MTDVDEFEAALREAAGRAAAAQGAVNAVLVEHAGGAAMAALADLRRWIDDGSAILHALWDQLSDCDSLALVAALQAVADKETGLQPALGDFVRAVEQLLGKRHGKGPVCGPDGEPVAAVEWRYGSATWDVDEAWPKLVAAARKGERQVLDPEAGELEDDVAMVARQLREVLGVGYLRVGAARQLGVDPDEYRHSAPGRWAVKLP